MSGKCANSSFPPPCSAHVHVLTLRMYSTMFTMSYVVPSSVHACIQISTCKLLHERRHSVQAARRLKNGMKRLQME